MKLISIFCVGMLWLAAPVSALAQSTDNLECGRFRLEGDRLHDTKTRLTWWRCVDGRKWNAATEKCDGAAIPSETYKFASSSTLPGFRLPTIDELKEMADIPKTCPSFHKAFPGFEDQAWSSTPAGPGRIWILQNVRCEEGVNRGKPLCSRPLAISADGGYSVTGNVAFVLSVRDTP